MLWDLTQQPIRVLQPETEKSRDIKAAGLLKFTLDEKFVGTLLMMCEILPALDRLLKVLQTRPLQVDLLRGMITSAVKALEAQKNHQTRV